MRRFREIDPKIEPEPPKPFSEMRWIALAIIALVGLFWLQSAAKKWDIERKKQDLITLREVNYKKADDETQPPEFNVPVPKENQPEFDSWTYEQEMMHARRAQEQGPGEIPVQFPPIEGLSPEEALEKVDLANE
ncbi:MAG: hypothetical protein AAGA58_07155 [Verrucomicrobiota bacterium]